VNRFRMKDNIKGGIVYLRYLLGYYDGNEVLALSAYNAGTKETNRLVRKVGSEDFVVYREESSSEQIRNYALNVLAALKAFDHYEKYGTLEEPVVTDK
jgi:soluble lytic murein transglycosylase-like protein